jgi:UDP-glucose 4-epimerase
MAIKGKRFLIIGGAGLIGSHTADELIKEDMLRSTLFPP